MSHWTEKATNDTAINWDGRLNNGSDAADGVYFWIVEYKDYLDNVHTRKGTVTLIR